MSFPTSLFSPREIENKPGAVYNPDKKRVLYAEDINGITSEIIQIEKRLIPSEDEPLPFDIRIGTQSAGFVFSNIEITDTENQLFGTVIPLLKSSANFQIQNDPEDDPIIIPDMPGVLTIDGSIFVVANPSSLISPEPKIEFSDQNFPSSEYVCSLTLLLDSEYGSDVGKLSFFSEVGFVFNHGLNINAIPYNEPAFVLNNSGTLSSPVTGSLWRDGDKLYFQSSSGAKELQFV